MLVDVLQRTRPQLRLDTPFLRATRPFVAGLAQQVEATSRRAELPESQRPANVAEVFGAMDGIHCLRIRYGG